MVLPGREVASFRRGIFPTSISNFGAMQLTFRLFDYRACRRCEMIQLGLEWALPKLVGVETFRLRFYDASNFQSNGDCVDGV